MANEIVTEGFFKLDRYFMILNAANYIRGFEIDDGLNDFSKSKDEDGKPMTIEFVEIENIFAFIELGPCFREVYVTSDTPIITEGYLVAPSTGEQIPGFFTRKADLGAIRTWTPQNIIDLINYGADITVADYNIVRWALRYSFEVFYFLQEYICERSEDEWDYVVNMLLERKLM